MKGVQRIPLSAGGHSVSSEEADKRGSAVVSVCDVSDIAQ